MDIEALLNLGLNKAEAEAYFALQELGEAKTGLLCKKLGIPNSHIYSILDSLMRKGLVGFKLKNKIKVYKPTEPESLQLLFKRKQEQLKAQEKDILSLIGSLKLLPKNKETDSDYQYYEGVPAIKSMIQEIYMNTPKNSTMFLLSAKSESWEKINAFFLEMHKLRVRRKVTLNMLMQEQTKNLQQHIRDRKKIGLVNIKLTNFNNDAEILITQKHLAIIDTSTKTKTPCGFKIENPIFIAMFNELFQFIWNSKK